MILLRVFCKPFKLKDFPKDKYSDFVYEEVVGLGYHPERLETARPGLLTSLPRIAIDVPVESGNDIENIRLSLRSGEWGDGKIIVFNVESYQEF